LDGLEKGVEYYSRLPALVESDFVAGRLAASVKDAGVIEERFQESLQYDDLDGGIFRKCVIGVGSFMNGCTVLQL
jgi:hypothetical protein